MRRLKLIDEVVIILKVIIPQSLENRAALRTAIAALVTMLIAFAFHFDKPYWSAMTVVILANVYTGSVIDKAILRIIGATMGAWIGYFLAGLVVNSLFLYLLAIFLLVSFAIYYYSFSPHAYAYLLAGLSAFIVISELAVMPDQAFYLAIWRPIDISLGVIVSAVSAWCIFPNNIHESLIKDTDFLFDQVAHLLKELNQQIFSEKPDFQLIAADNLELKKRIRKSMELFGFARRELGIKRVKLDQYRAIFNQFYDFSRSLSYVLSSYPIETSLRQPNQLTESLANFFSTAQEDLRLLKNAFISENKLNAELHTELLLAKLHEVLKGESADEHKLPLKVIKQYLDISPFLNRSALMIGNLSHILINNPVPAKKKTQLISNQQQLRNDTDTMTTSIKTALAAILALSFWLVSNWPGGVNGIISSIIISIKKHLFEMKNISVYRFLGCLIGGGVALFPLTFFDTDLYSFIVILFFSVWLFSYFSFKYTAYAYVGLQANIAFAIAMGQSGSPPVELEPALERLAGIVIGIVASFLVGNVLWRTDFFSLLSRNLRKLFRFLVHNLDELLQASETKICLYDLTNSFWLCRGLLEAFPNEYFKEKKRSKLIEFRNNFLQMTLVQATISHIYEGIDQEGARTIAASYGIDLSILEEAVLALYKSFEAKGLCESVLHCIDKFLSKNELSSAYQLRPSKELANCIAYMNALSQLRKIFLSLKFFA